MTLPVSTVLLEPFAEEPTVSVLRLYGDIGLEAITRISALVDDLVEKKRFHLLVDLSQVNFLSSPVVGALMGCRERLMRRSGSIALLAPKPELAEKLNLMGVNLVFPYYSNKNAFLRHFRWEYQSESRSLTLEVPAYAGYVPAIRRLIAGLLLSKGYTPREAFQLESIVDELSNNAIEHGLPIDKKFSISFSFDKSSIHLAVANGCKTLSSEAQELIREKFRNPCIILGSMRGRGIALVKKIASDMTFRVDAQRVQVSITKMREES